MAAKTLVDQWEDAKSEFERITGEKKKSKSKLAGSVFSKGLTPSLKSLEKKLDALQVANDQPTKDAKSIAKAVAAARKEQEAAEKTGEKYKASLKSDADDDIADNRGQKTELSKGLKYLVAEIDRLLAVARQKIDTLEIANSGLAGKEQYYKMVVPSLVSATKVSIAAIKKVKADPTPATWKSLFYVTDPPGRKMHVQLQAAVRANQEGAFPNLSVDPAVLVERLDDWRGSPPTYTGPQIHDDAPPEEILDRLEVIRSTTQAVVRYLEELQARQ